MNIFYPEYANNDNLLDEWFLLSFYSSRYRLSYLPQFQIYGSLNY